MRRLFIALVPVLALVACKKGETVGCASDASCPSGHVCMQAKCAQLCQTDQDCAHGYVCAVDVCETGQRSDAPRLDAVFGNGTQSCPDAVAGYCFADALKLQGGSLTGASFRLEATGVGESFDLPPGESRSDIEVTVMLPQALYEGTFTLVAMNSVGSDQVSVQILRGEAGPAGPDMSGDELLAVINSEATTRFAVTVMPTANDLINHLNSGSVKLDPAILPPASGGTTYTGNDIVNLINNGATTKIDADELATHTHSGADITSGTVPYARLPVGTTAGTVAAGDHTHAGGGAMTGTQIITAINDVSTSGQIPADHVVTGTTAGTVATGDHTHAGNTVIGWVNSGSTSINTSRLNVGTTAGTVAAGDHTHSGSGTSDYHLQRTSGTAGTFVAVDDATLVSLCGDGDGCTVMLGYSHFQDPCYGEAPSVLWGPPCRLHLDGSRNWAISPWCLQTMGGSTPYASWGWGRDNDSSGNLVVLEYEAADYGMDTSPCTSGYPASTPKAACQLAESNGGTDNQAGLYFQMTSTANTNFDLGSRTCELLIQD